MRIINIALNNLKVLLSDKWSAFWLIALPVVMTLIIGSSMAEEPSTGIIPVAVYDEDGSFYSQYIIDSIERDDILTTQLVDYSTGENMVANNEVAGFVYIPKDFGLSLENKGTTNITFYPAARSVSPLSLEKILQKSVGELNNSMGIAQGIVTVFNPDIGLNELVGDISQGFKHSPIEVEFMWTAGESTGLTVPMGMNQSSPGMAVMFTMMVVVFSGAGTILRERQNGTLGRLLVTPVSKVSIILGKTLGVFLVGFAQISILILIGQFILGVNWGNDIIATLVLSMAFVFASTGIAMTLAAITKNPSQLGVIGNIIVIVMSMLGGGFWPTEVLSDNMQLVAKMVPTGWAINGYTNIILRGMNLGDIWLNIVVLLLFGALFISFGIYRLRLEAE